MQSAARVTVLVSCARSKLQQDCGATAVSLFASDDRQPRSNDQRFGLRSSFTEKAIVLCQLACEHVIHSVLSPRR